MQYYDDPDFSYPSFWNNREYEHEAELLALQRLLGDKRFGVVADIGGGFGRLADFLSRYSQNIFLIEPAAFQRKLGQSFISNQIMLQEGNSERTGLQTKSCDLVVMIRVMHHILDPEASVSELWRILKPNGLLVLEFANSHNFKARIRNFFRPIPLTPVDMNTSPEYIPFFNHHPATIKKILRDEGFIVLNELSVSNFRSTFLKRILPLQTLLILERFSQRLLAWIDFGPSIFLMATKRKSIKKIIIPINSANIAPRRSRER